MQGVQRGLERSHAGVPQAVRDHLGEGEEPAGDRRERQQVEISRATEVLKSEELARDERHKAAEEATNVFYYLTYEGAVDLDAAVADLVALMKGSA